MTTIQIDWTAHDEHPENTCTCRCGVTFRSHSKMFVVPTPNLVSRKACPACGGIALQRASFDPEVMTLGAATPPSGAAKESDRG